MTGPQEFLAGRKLVNANSVIGAAKGDLKAIGGKRGAKHSIVAGGDGILQRPGRNVPELHFSESCRSSSGGHERFAVRGEGQRLNAIGDTNQASFGPRPVPSVEQNLSIS